MIIGLCGAHRTGKTTLASEFAKRNQTFTFAATSVSAMMKANGMDPALDYPIVERLAMQGFILNELDRFYGTQKGNVVFDRTPLDAAAYTLADVQRENVDPQLHPSIVEYVRRAIEITNRRFSVMLFIPPVLPLVHEEGKAPATPAYVEHISQIINGLCGDERMLVKHFMMPRRFLDIETRLRAMDGAVAKVMSHHMVDIENRNLGGVAIH